MMSIRGQSSGWTTRSSLTTKSVGMVAGSFGYAVPTAWHLAESIRIVNTGSTSRAGNFFQYSDFDIEGSDGDIVDLENSNQWKQFDPNVAVAETTSGATANRCWAAPFPTIQDSLNDDAATTLPGDNANASDPDCGPLG